MATRDGGEDAGAEARAAQLRALEELRASYRALHAADALEEARAAAAKQV